MTREDAEEILKFITGQDSLFDSTENGAWENARRAAADALEDARVDIRDCAQILRYEAGNASALK